MRSALRVGPPSCTPQVVQETTPADRCVCVNLDGRDIYFEKADLPDPPAIHFSDDIPGLFLEWHASRRLIIAGHGIPIKHWDKLYKKRNKLVETDAWKAIKVEWGNWKFLVEERERFPTEDAFWHAYSDEKGERMSYQHILDKLQQGRGCTDDADYDAAMKYFEGNLERADTRGLFRYRKRGIWRVCSKRLTIARIWRKLLSEDPEIQANWAAMQSANTSGSGEP
ncbi:uncharacterized protein B0H18DRAFT_875189 [Fomitopsis serialis]|uniref:uncharacterized protein n=1 Tax=Fomitopsis serialis TaxID=139415 RepID=UPI0020087C66|nr:uncharacterized protein B0H18DRAFT_875189 [Neoantrodia serialis]KAH9927790.1 hypothetical protein B0H18DRAFT_875189 [Neoantrodia serialis]